MGMIPAFAGLVSNDLEYLSFLDAAWTEREASQLHGGNLEF
jgi:hypothetical protein